MDGVLADFNTGWMTALQPRLRHGPGRVDGAAVGWALPAHAFRLDVRVLGLGRRGTAAPRSVTRRRCPGPSKPSSASAAKHRVVIVSSKFDWAIPDSLAWLADHDVPAREVHFLWDKTLAGCDIYLDDAPHQLEELTAGAAQCRRVPHGPPLERSHARRRRRALLDGVRSHRRASGRRTRGGPRSRLISPRSPVRTAVIGPTHIACVRNYLM